MAARKRKTPDAGPPTRGDLHEAALAYLARGAATAESVRKTLERRTAAWARRAMRAGSDADQTAAEAAAAREVIPEIVARLREVGLVDDRAFATARARTMSRGGRSRRAIAAHLSAKGVASATVREAVPPDAGVELAAAIAFARKRRLGPYSAATDDVEMQDPELKRQRQRKVLAAMARAGFDFGMCERVLRMSREEADDRLRGHREL